MFKKLWKDEVGLTTVEYALLLAVVAIASITAWAALSHTTPKIGNAAAPRS